MATVHVPELNPKDQNAIEFSKKLEKFFTDFHSLTLRLGIDDLLSETEDNEIKVLILIKEYILRKDISEIFLATVASLRKREDPIPLEESIRIYGIQNALAFILVYKISDQIQCKLLSKDPKTQRILAAPASILKYAYRARTTYGEDGRYKDSAFASGLMYDLLLLKTSADLPGAEAKKIADFIENRFARGIKIGTIALELAKAKKKLALEKHLVSVAMIREAAKIVMATLNPTYIDFIKQIEKLQPPLSLRNLAEIRKFGGHYQDISQALGWSFEIFSGMNEVLDKCDTPYMLQSEKKLAEFDLAAICFLAAFISRAKPDAAQTQSLTQASDLRPELFGLDLSFNLAAVLNPGSPSGGKK